MSNRSFGTRQTTLRAETELTGIGVHSGAPATIILHPARENTGIVFVGSGLLDRNDQDSVSYVEIPASYRSVSNVTLCTVLQSADGVTLATVEHLMAAIRGLGIDNLVIEFDSHEVPIMDGSAAAFVNAIDEVGIKQLSAPRKLKMKTALLKSPLIMAAGSMSRLIFPPRSSVVSAWRLI